MKEMSFTDFCKVFEAYAAYKEAQVAAQSVKAPAPGVSAPLQSVQGSSATGTPSPTSVAPTVADPLGYANLQGVQTPQPTAPMTPPADAGFAALSQRVAALEQVKQPSIPDPQAQTVDDIIVKLLQ